MPDESLPCEPTPRQPPPCEQCLTADRVCAITMAGLFEGIEYWQCLACGRVWGTRHGKPTREAWA